MVQGRFGNAGNRSSSQGGKSRGIRNSTAQAGAAIDQNVVGKVVDTGDEGGRDASPSKATGRKGDRKATSSFNTRASSQRKYNMPSKLCLMCGASFDWRKKWEDCWDEITTCSKSCNADRRLLKRLATELTCPSEVNNWTLEERCKAVQAAKVEGRLRRERRQSEQTDVPQQAGVPKEDLEDKAEATEAPVEKATTDGPGPCNQCGALADLLVCCQVDATGKWYHLCDDCWPAASGGEMFCGDSNHPNYVFGSVWVKPRSIDPHDNEIFYEPPPSLSTLDMHATPTTKKRSRGRRRQSRDLPSSDDNRLEELGQARHNSELDVLRDGMHLLSIDSTCPDDLDPVEAALDSEFFSINS